jgi:peptidyl-tRNA hydrolase
MNFSKGIPRDDSDVQVPPGEPEKVPGYVKNKIKAHKSSKQASPSSRARKEIRGSLSKIIKKAASITELLTEHDQQENLRVIRQAKKATHRIYDGEQKRLIEAPDHKTRLAAVALDLAYREGKPVERSISATGDLNKFPELLERLRHCESYQESLQKPVLGNEIAPTLPEPQ